MLCCLRSYERLERKWFEAKRINTFLERVRIGRFKMRLTRVRFTSWKLLIPFLIAADLFALWVWAARPPRVYSHWLGLVGFPEQAPIPRLVAWAGWENGPRTPAGCVSLFETGELFFAGVLVLALVLLILILTARRADGRLWHRLSAPFSLTRAIAVRFRVRTALAVIMILCLYLGWEIHAWRTWRLRSAYLQRAGEAAIDANRNLPNLQSKREELARLLETDVAQLTDLSASGQGVYRSKAALIAERAERRDRLQREISDLSAGIAVYAEWNRKYERAAGNPWVAVPPDEPLRKRKPEAYESFSRGPARALARYDELARMYPDLVEAHSASAWIRATCRDARYRDGELAVASATRACELTNWQDTGALGVLAAACAEAGDFAAAVNWQQKGLALLATPANAIAYREALALYVAGKPYRQN